MNTLGEDLILRMLLEQGPWPWASPLSSYAGYGGREIQCL